MKYDRIIKDDSEILSSREKQQVVDDVRGYYKTAKGWDADANLVNNNKFASGLHNSKRLSKARSEMDELKKLADDYDNNEDVRYKYKIKAMGQFDNVSEVELKKRYPKGNIYLMYEDWDQGRFGSFDLYLRDRGSSLDEFSYKSTKALNDYKSECEKTVKGLLSEYGNKQVDRQYNWQDKTVNAAITDALVELAEYENKLHYAYA